MIEFDAVILQFAQQGEKTGWSYIDIPADLAQQLKPGNKKSFRVKGYLDASPVSGMALMPMGDGNFIMALKADIRKRIRKNSGAMLHVKLKADDEHKVDIPEQLQECFDFEPEAIGFFNSLTEGHRRYFINWINSAKTSETKAKRVINTVNAMLRKWDYGQMIRGMKKEKEY
jgi:hypothetical protein